jgi:hypothetical protein
MWGEWEHFPSCVLESLKGLKRKTDEGSMLLFGRGVDVCVSLNSVSGNILHVHSSLFSNSARLDDGWLPLLHATGMVLGSGRWLLVDRQLDGWMDGWIVGHVVWRAQVQLSHFCQEGACVLKAHEIPRSLRLSRCE